MRNQNKVAPAVDLKPEATASAHSKNPLFAGGVLRLRQVLEIYPVSASTWWAGVRSGRYPKAIKLGQGARATGWRADDIRALIDGATETETQA